MDISNDTPITDPVQPVSRLVLTPDNPPWNIPVAIGVWLLSVIFILAVPMFFVVPYVVSQGLDYSDQARLKDFLVTDPTVVILQLAPIILAHLLTLFVAWFVVTKANAYSFRDTLGWNMNGFRVWHSIALTLFFFGVVATLTVIFGKVENDFDRLIKTSRVAVYLIAFFATFTAPIVEEVVYRGLLYSAFKRRWGTILAIIVPTLLFTLVHVPQYSVNNTPDYATVITLLLLSLTLTLVRSGTGNLLPCIVLHTIFNGIQSVLLIAEPYVMPSDPVVPPGFFF
ncbi:MAG TPA: CPBP family intramembrane glutamic endopeptidase [Pyrinomonadaceae bacterium]|nr:CPBP family intramembrane glutamic endopeptidase [Pyrinomonadaceae bacterium]